MKRQILLLCFLGVCLVNIAASFKICAFNIQSFGEAKANNKKVMGLLLKVVFVHMIQISLQELKRIREIAHIKGLTCKVTLFNLFLIVKILARCDLCLIQEVRDSKGGAIPTLVKDLNRCNI